jgi:hypothetical protein
MINPFVKVIVEVAPIAVVEAVTAANTTSEINLGLEPDVSVKKTLCTLAADAPAVACADVKVRKSILVPSVAPVRTSTKVPEPSLAVFAAAIVAVTALGVNAKIGEVFAAIVNY